MTLSGKLGLSGHAYKRVVGIVRRLRHQDAVRRGGGLDEVMPADIDHDLGALHPALRQGKAPSKCVIAGLTGRISTWSSCSN